MYNFNAKYFASINRIIISGLALSFMLVNASCGEDAPTAPAAPTAPVVPEVPAPTAPEAPVPTKQEPPLPPPANLLMADAQDYLASLAKYEAFSFGLDGPLLKRDQRYLDKADLQVFIGLKQEGDADKLVLISPDLKSKFSEEPKELRDALFEASNWQEDLPSTMLMILEDPKFKVTTAYSKGLPYQNLVYSDLESFDEYTLYEEATEITNDDVKAKKAALDKKISDYDVLLRETLVKIYDLDRKFSLNDPPIKQALIELMLGLSSGEIEKHPSSLFALRDAIINDNEFQNLMNSNDKEELLAAKQIFDNTISKFNAVKNFCNEKYLGLRERYSDLNEENIKALGILYKDRCVDIVEELVRRIRDFQEGAVTDSTKRAKEIYYRLGGGKPQPKEKVPTIEIPPAPTGPMPAPSEIPPAPTELMPAPSKIPPPPTSLPPSLPPKVELPPAPAEILPSPKIPIPPPPPPMKPTTPPLLGQPPLAPLGPAPAIPPVKLAPSTAPKPEELSLQTPTEQFFNKNRLFQRQKILYGFDAREDIKLDDEKRKLSAYFGLLGGGPTKKEYLRLYAVGPEFVSPKETAKNYAAFFDGDMKLRYPVELIKDIETKGPIPITDKGASVTVEQITKLPAPILLEIFDPLRDMKDSIKADEQLENLQRFALNLSDTFKGDVVTDGMTKSMAAIKINPTSLDPTPKMEDNLNNFINTARRFLRETTPSEKKDEEYLSKKLNELSDFKPLLSEENALKAKENFELIKANLNTIQKTCKTLKEERDTLAKNVKGFQSVTLEDSKILIKFGCQEGGRKLAWAHTCLATIIEDICIKPTEELLQKATKNTDAIDADKTDIEKRGITSKYQKAMQSLYDRLKTELKKVDPEVEKVEREVAGSELVQKLIERRKELEKEKEEEKEEEEWD